MITLDHRALDDALTLGGMSIDTPEVDRPGRLPLAPVRPGDDRDTPPLAPLGYDEEEDDDYDEGIFFDDDEDDDDYAEEDEDLFEEDEEEDEQDGEDFDDDDL